ncbi:MAG: sulfotransferase family 2 domain-containing protein [Anaerolineae bacterium]
MIALVHMHKTAGTTLATILKRSFGIQHCTVYCWQKGKPFFSASDYRRLARLYPRLESISGHDIKPYSDLETVRPDILYYTFLRNPLDRTASQYQYEVQMGGGKRSFEEWIERPENRDYQVDKLTTEKTAAAAIATLESKGMFVGVMERFDESIVMFQRRVGPDRLRDIRYHRKLVAPNNEIKKRLLTDPATRAMLEEANREDLALWEHVMSDLYPRQQREYGAGLEEAVAAFRERNARMSRLNSTLTPRYVTYSAKWWGLYIPLLQMVRAAGGRR